MRPYAIFLALFTFVMLSTPPASDSAAGVNELSAGAVGGLSRTDLWVLRLASDFSIVQGRIADMMVHDELGGWTKDHLLRIEKRLREDVMTVVGAAVAGDHDAVRVLLPTVARQLRRQILILIEDDGVARQWVAARRPRRWSRGTLCPGPRCCSSPSPGSNRHGRPGAFISWPRSALLDMWGATARSALFFAPK